MCHNTRSWGLAAAIAMAAAAGAEEPSLLGHWKFDDGFGDVASDSSGLGNHGDMYNADWVRGPFGVALRLNGEGAHVAAGEISDIDGSNALTVEAWVCWEGTGRYPNIVSIGRWNPGGAILFVSDRTCSFRMGRPGARAWTRDTGWRETGAPLLSGFKLRRWYHLAATFDRPHTRTYVDGEPVGQGTWDFPVGAKGEVLIGKWGGNVGHQGLIDEVKIYSRALAPEEIKASHDRSSPGRTTPDAASYKVIAADANQEPPAWTLENEYVRLEFSKRLRLTGLIDRKTGTNQLARSSTWASLRTQRRNYRPSSFHFDRGRLTIQFGSGDARATLLVRAKPHYFVFEVESVAGKDVQQLVFANLLAKPAKYVHSMPGLAADDDFGLCLRSMNLKARPTIGGRPPTLRVLCQPEHGMDGAKAALVAAPMGRLRDALKEIVLNEDVPGSRLGGPFALDAPLNRVSYMFAGGLSESNVDEWIEMAQTACIPIVHMSGWYHSQGHYAPRASCFPRGMEGLKAVVDKIHAAGLLVGMHTLTGCIQPHDPFASPKPDPRLSKDLEFTLTRDVGEGDTVIYLDESPAGLNTVWNYSSRGNVVQIGGELVQFRGIQTEPPYALTQCARGRWGSPIQAYAKGTKAHHLFARYTSFQPDEHSTLVGDVADCIADTVNSCGFDLIYHDGAEGMPARHYGAARMRTAIVERFKRDVRVESSWSGLHHCWWFHSCVGAWDHPLWGLKRCVDQHCERNVAYQKLSLMPAQLGWWAILGPARHHDAERPDEVEYLCAKALGHDMSMSFQTLRPASQPWNARQGEYLAMIGRYEKLRLSGYFSDEVKERLRTPREEFQLTQAADGEWQFVPTDYLDCTPVASDPARRRWSLTNRFAPQKPRLRIEALYAAKPYGDPDGLLMAEFTEPNEFHVAGGAPGVSTKLTLSSDRVKVGTSSACLKSVNTRASRVGAWARVAKTFSPDLDLGQCAALGLWIHGDGKGEVINFQLRSPALYHGCYDEHIVPIDFEGWRYFELLVRERTSNEHFDYKWPYGWAMSVCRHPLVTRHVSELNIYYNNLPPGDEVTCYISPIKALPVVRTRLTRPQVAIAGKRVVFPVSLTSGEYLEFTPGSDCKLRDERGEVLDEVTAQGEAPVLAAGANTVEFACEAEPGLTPRAKVTVVAVGEPFRGVAKGKEHLKRQLRRLDDHYLALGPDGSVEFVRQDNKVVRRLDGRDNVWAIENDSGRAQSIVRLKLRVGQEIPGAEYDKGLTLADFEDPSQYQDREPQASLVAGPGQKGLARKGVDGTFECSTRGAKIGKRCGVLRGRSALGDRSGWAAVGRKLPAPADLSRAEALALWVKGDGKGATLKVQLRDSAGSCADYYVGLDFTTWRYFELAQPAMGEIDRSRVAAVAFYLLSLPRNGSAACWVDGLRAIRSLPSRQVGNPAITIGDATLRFPTTLRPGDAVTLDASGQCHVVSPDGRKQPLRASAALPKLQPGATSVRFTCERGLGNEVRVSITRK